MEAEVKGDQVTGRVVHINEIINNSKFNKFFLFVFLLTYAVLLFDGFDMQLYGSVLTVMVKDLGLNSAQTGLLASTSLWGCVVGGVTLGFLTDKLGRKKVITLAVILYGALTGFCGLTHSIPLFAALRFFSGMGIVTVTPTITSIVSEYTPLKNRPFFLNTNGTGVACGNFLTPLISVALLPVIGWRGMFMVAFASVVTIPAIIHLPETMVLLKKKNRNKQIAAILEKADPTFRAQPGDIYELSRSENVKLSLTSLFKNGLARNTVLIWVMFFVNMFLMFSFLTWLPKLITLLGYSLRNSLLLSSVFAFGTFLAGPFVGTIANKFSYKRAFLCCYALAIVSLLLLTLHVPMGVFAVFLFMLGLAFIFLSLMYPFVAANYPIAVRATGLGTGASIARMGSALAPIVLGYMLQANWAVNQILLFLIIPAVVGIVAVLLTEKPRHA